MSYDLWLRSLDLGILRGVSRRNLAALAGDGTGLMEFVQRLEDKGRIPSGVLTLESAREVATQLQQRLDNELARRERENDGRLH